MSDHSNTYTDSNSKSKISISWGGRTMNKPNQFDEQTGGSNMLPDMSTLIPMTLPTIPNMIPPMPDLSSMPPSVLAKEMFRATIESGILASILGPDIAYLFHYIGVIINYLILAAILLVIFNICLVIHTILQISLDISHKVVGGIGNTMQDAVDGAVIPGIKLGPIKIPSIKLLGFLQSPTDDVKRADAKIPTKATDVIIDLISSFFNKLIE